MLTRLAACLLSVGLLSNVGDARGFARAPEAPVSITEALPIPMPVVAAPDRAAVKKVLEKRRAKNLAAFRAYWKAGVYPHNFVRSGPLNVWIDRDGHLCAAATMISKDGKHELVIQIGKDDNQIRLLNVTNGPLMDWVLTSGFTLEEIDQIQMPSMGRDGTWRMMPLEPVPDWTAEDARLRKGYAATYAALTKNKQAGLDMAVARLMENPALARKLVNGTL